MATLRRHTSIDNRVWRSIALARAARAYHPRLLRTS